MTIFSNWGIISVFVSLLFGSWGVYLALRKKKYPASLVFIKEQSINLFNDLAKKLPNLSVIYKDAPLDRSIVLLSGYIVNDGSIDITEQMVEKEIYATLPKKCKWLECEIISKAADLSVKTEIKDGNRLFFSFGLFRKGESFSFQALISLDEYYSINKKEIYLNKMKWDHRIANLGSVKNNELPEKQGNRIRKRLVQTFVLIVGLLYLTLAGNLIYNNKLIDLVNAPVIHYTINKNGIAREYLLKPKNDGTTIVEDVESKKREIVDLRKFAMEHEIIPIAVDDPLPGYMMSILVGMLIVGGIFMIYMGIEKELKYLKIKKLIIASCNET